MGRRRRHLGILAAATLLGAIGGGLAGAAPISAGPDDDGDDGADAARAQLLVYLLANTDLVPGEVSCAPRPGGGTSGDQLCVAVVGDDQTISALATLTAPGTYSFTAITKAGPAEPGATPQGGPTVGGSSAEADAAATASIDSAVADLDGLGSYLTAQDPAIVSVDGLDYDPATVTLQVVVTTSATTPAARDTLAFLVTDTMAYLWESGQPVRAEASTIHPRLEVIVDGEIYGTPYDVMAGVADYEIAFDQWLAISTGTNAFRVVATGSAEQPRRYHARPAVASTPTAA